MPNYSPAGNDISNSFGDKSPETTVPKAEDDSESLWTKVKRWLESQFSAPSLGEGIAKEMKKSKEEQLTPNKK